MRSKTYPWRYLMWGALAMVVFTSLAVYGMAGTFLPKPLFFGWLINLFNAYSAAEICRQSVGRGMTGFFGWAFLANSARVSVMLVIMVGMVVRIEEGRMLWIIPLMIGYFCLLGAEVLAINEISRKGAEPNGS